MKNNNRKAVTVRFNLAEQRDLENLADFLKTDPVRALKTCFYQMISSLKEVQKKLKEKENEEANVLATGAIDVLGDSEPYVAKSAEERASAFATARASEG